MKRIAIGVVCGLGLLLVGCGSDSNTKDGTEKTVNPIVSIETPSENSSDATAADAEQVDCSMDENSWTPTVASESYELDCKVEE